MITFIDRCCTLQQTVPDAIFVKKLFLFGMMKAGMPPAPMQTEPSCTSAISVTVCVKVGSIGGKTVDALANV